MPRLLRNGAVVGGFAGAPAATTLDDLPDGEPAIVSLALWQAERSALLARGDIGVELSPSDDPEALAADVATLPVISVRFPNFADGRGYSTARLLRDRYGFGGELRAAGDVQRDQVHYLHHVGFDAFEVPDGVDIGGFAAALAEFSDGYQGTTRRVPWFRRRNGAASATA